MPPQLPQSEAELNDFLAYLKSQGHPDDEVNSFGEFAKSQMPKESFLEKAVTAGENAAGKVSAAVSPALDKIGEFLKPAVPYLEKTPIGAAYSNMMRPELAPVRKVLGYPWAAAGQGLVGLGGNAMLALKGQKTNTLSDLAKAPFLDTPPAANYLTQAGVSPKVAKYTGPALDMLAQVAGGHLAGKAGAFLGDKFYNSTFSEANALAANKPPELRPGAIAKSEGIWGNAESIASQVKDRVKNWMDQARNILGQASSQGAAIDVDKFAAPAQAQIDGLLSHPDTAVQATGKTLQDELTRMKSDFGPKYATPGNASNLTGVVEPQPFKPATSPLAMQDAGQRYGEMGWANGKPVEGDMGEFYRNAQRGTKAAKEASVGETLGPDAEAQLKNLTERSGGLLQASGKFNREVMKEARQAEKYPGKITPMTFVNSKLAALKQLGDAVVLPSVRTGGGLAASKIGALMQTPSARVIPFFNMLQRNQ